MKRPLLAASLSPEDAERLVFPLLATPKVDGVRALMVNGKLVSRSFKAIPNTAVRLLMESILPDGADGELCCGTLQDTVSAVMSRSADFTGLKYYWFDWVRDSRVDVAYKSRVSHMAIYLTVHESNPHVDKVLPLVPELIHNIAELNKYEQRVLEQGFEGVVLRDPDGVYKCGRSTVREQIMIKMKRFYDSEANVVGIEELMHNLNDEKVDAFGHIKRGSSKNNKVKGNTLGSIIASLPDGQIFKVGTGYTTKQRDNIWKIRDSLIGQLVKYRCASYISGVPKSATFLGIRHVDDN